jgi:hypothetical protein
MHRLRTARHLVRLVLAWFALAIGVAVASPVFSPKSIELLCSGSGTMKLLVKANDGTPVTATHGTLDCPLCASFSAPPPAVTARIPLVHPLGHAAQPIPSARIAALTAATPPARGPPPAAIN